MIWLQKQIIVPFWWSRVQQSVLIYLINQDNWIWIFVLILKKLLQSVYQRQVDTCDFSVTDHEVKSCKEIFENRRQDGFLAMEVGSKFSDRNFSLGFTAVLLEQGLLSSHLICLCFCSVHKMRKIKWNCFLCKQSWYFWLESDKNS